jgi:hypothetical protein
VTGGEIRGRDESGRDESRPYRANCPDYGHPKADS